MLTGGREYIDDAAPDGELPQRFDQRVTLITRFDELFDQLLGRPPDTGLEVQDPAQETLAALQPLEPRERRRQDHVDPPPDAAIERLNSFPDDVGVRRQRAVRIDAQRWERDHAPVPVGGGVKGAQVEQQRLSIDATGQDDGQRPADGLLQPGQHRGPEATGQTLQHQPLAGGHRAHRGLDTGMLRYNLRNCSQHGNEPLGKRTYPPTDGVRRGSRS